MSAPGKVVVLILLAASWAVGGAAQTVNGTAKASTPDRAAAYYHFALGHLYSELAGAYGNRGEYLTKAIENYKQAMKADPAAGFLAEELSDLYIQAGQLRTAVTEAEEALRQKPDDLVARRVLGRIYTRMIGDPRENRVNEDILRKAIEQYQKIVEKEPKDIETWLILGRLYKVAQNSVEAEKAYKKALEMDANNEDAISGLAMVYSDLGDTKSAADMLSKAVERNPNLRTLTSLAAAYEQMREYALAAQTLRRALDVDPGGNPEIKRALAQNLMLSDQLPEALKLYEELAAADPKDAQSWLRISQIYRQQRNFPKAWQAAAKAKELASDNLEVSYNEVSLFEAEGRLSQAIDALKEILAGTSKRSYNAAERTNRVTLLERLGLLYRSSDRLEDAVAAFREIASLDPTLAPRASAQIIESYRAAKEFTKAAEESAAAGRKFPADRTLTTVRASLAADLGQTAEAVAALNKLLEGKDSDREVHLSLAQVWEKARNFTEVAKAIDAAEKLSDSKEEKEGVCFTRGAMYEKMKRFDDAEAEFRKVLALNPDNASAMNYLGYMFADRNVRLAEAQKLIEKALELDPGNGAYLDSLGWVYFRLGKLKEAEDYLRRALERYARDATIHDHLGDVYAGQGRLKDAIAQWQSALKEWEAAPPSEADPAEIAKVRKKHEGARVRLAKEAKGVPR